MNLPRTLFRLLLGRRLPVTGGTMTAPGIDGPVTIRRDGYGIPYIEAESNEDAWYGVGFCQGQDRTFQLEMVLRVARGTLSELLGESYLGVDRLSRQIGFVHAAVPQMDAIEPGTVRVLEAFARGVNEGSTLGARRRAHEFTLLRGSPTAYSAVDVIAIGKLQAFLLASNWDIELARYHILREDGPEALEALDPGYPEWHRVTAPPGVPQGPAADRLAEDLSALREVVGQAGGSNSWALAPSRTAAGRAILSNDPHLRPTLPPHWYFAHVRTPEWGAAGATFAGAPAFPAGHNGFAAWGVTAGFVDNSDLFLEELGSDGRSVRQGDGFAPCEVREEVIGVKGKPDVVEKVVVTPRGPIVGAAVGGGVGAMSLRATWLDPRPVNGLMGVHRAGSFEEFRTICEAWPLSSLNMLYADTSGAIGWQLMGDAPRRRKGWGTVPQPGWEAGAGWEDGLVPFEDIPHAESPPEGILASANNSPTPSGEGPFLGVDWLDGYRVGRIFEALESREDWDVAATSALHLDSESLPWREMREIVCGSSPGGQDARRALELLEPWDGDLNAGSSAATVFQLFLAHMHRQVAQAKAPRSWAWVVGAGPNAVVPRTMLLARRVGHLVRLLKETPEGWFEKGWDRAIEDALAAAVNDLRAGYGDDESEWAWGAVRPLTLRHPVGDRKVLGGIYNLGPFPWGGDTNTISQAAAAPDDPLANPMAIASMRMVIDLGNWEESRFVLPGGQSGNPLSPHYDDMLPLWKRGDGVPIAWSADRVREIATTTLTLSPPRAQS